jgi:hypothetical protein
MPKREPRHSDKNAVAWLATTVVLILGTGACGFIILMFSDSPVRFLLTTLGAVVAFLAFALLLGDKENRELLRDRYGWLRYGRRSTAFVKYRFGRKTKSERASTAKELQPPTAESVRQLRDEAGLSTWVPSEHRPPPGGRVND